LPEITNDKGLAMTGSFTSMLLCGLLVSRIGDMPILEPLINTIIQCGEYILKNQVTKLKGVSEIEFSRAVFLGSGPFKGIASESHLKLQELTLGNIICKYDSFLGLRHGPKAVLDKNTLIVYLFSNDKYVQKFEKDLAKEIHEQKLGKYSMGIYDQYSDIDYLDTGINMGNETNGIDEEFLTLCYILPAQILAYYSSRKLGLDPDNPSESGIITRVVRGVNIYSYP
jgi:tagatose-6-phosphate ketose/aldose isomerase